MTAQQFSLATITDQKCEEPHIKLFDHFRAPAIEVLCKDKPVDKLVRKKWFIRLARLAGYSSARLGSSEGLGKSELKDVSFNKDLCRKLKHEFPALAQIAESLRLKPHEQLLLAFFANIRVDEFWNEFSKRFGNIDYNAVAPLLSRVFGLDTRLIYRALEPQSRLVTSGLLTRHAPRWEMTRLSDLFWLHHEIDVTTLKTPTAWEDFFASKFDQVRYEPEGIDFSHLEEDIAMILQVLKSLLTSRTRGVHVLLHGPPGTGKTTLAREVAHRLGIDLYEVRKLNAGSDTNDGERRFGVFNLAQKLGIAKSECLILFDEMEDLLPSSIDRFASKSNRLHKGWICDSLERTGLPTIWTANCLSGMDPAILRRITITLEVNSPPRSLRRKLLQQSLSNKNVRSAWLERTARLKYVTPALTAQMGRLASALPQEGTVLESTLDRWLVERLGPQGLTSLPPVREGQRFQCEFLNADPDPADIVEGLRGSGEGRICLHGPPGTGKTAFANHLAEALDREPIVRRGSDLRSPWVGETEQNIARMFREAGRGQKVLILDEADSFLGSRESSSHNWERNETSEFLVQLENFTGIFIATTNRFEFLDRALMRRFDFKVQLDYLSSQQRSRFFEQTVQHELSQSTLDALTGMHTLTPGEFATACRRLRFGSQELNEKNLLSALVHEASCRKEIEGRPIGFCW